MLRKAPLALEKAIARFNHFAENQDNLKYDLFLKLMKGDTYEGKVTATMDLQKVSPEFFIDYCGTEVLQIKVNGKDIPSDDKYEKLRNDRFIQIPHDNLQVGKNELFIHFRNNYASNGQGLHSFTDTDGSQYIYSELEPYYCNFIFPTFDQPDLKAPLSLTTATPNEWQVIANNPMDQTATNNLKVDDYLSAEEQATYKLRSFEPTPRISTYLYAVVAGNYKEIVSKESHNNIAMSLYARESLMKFLEPQAEEIFLIHRESIKFYEEFFGVPYPFKKCDSVFAVEYNMGAMENPGCILYNDIYVWKNKVPKHMNTSRSNTICHEVSHQWFGNLVTMKWWNDLWLNESFAEFISHYCQEKIYQRLIEKGVSHINPWANNHARKDRAYTEDQQFTTHPIAGEVRDTDEAKAIFDGITYNKGAATLRQLMALMGDKAFGTALGSYFKKYGWGNTTLNDFIGSL